MRSLHHMSRCPERADGPTTLAGARPCLWSVRKLPFGAVDTGSGSWPAILLASRGEWCASGFSAVSLLDSAWWLWRDGVRDDEARAHRSQ